MSVVDVVLKVMVIITKHSYYLRNLLCPDINIKKIKKKTYFYGVYIFVIQNADYSF